MTKEELEDNYQFKVTKKALMRELPFIKDVYVDEEDLEKYKTIMVHFIVDPYALGKMFGLPIWNAITRNLQYGHKYTTPLISLFIDGDNRYEDAKPITKAIEEIIQGVAKSPALPNEYKLSRPITHGSFTVLPSSLPPDMLSPQ